MQTRDTLLSHRSIVTGHVDRDTRDLHRPCDVTIGQDDSEDTVRFDAPFSVVNDRPAIQIMGRRSWRRGPLVRQMSLIWVDGEYILSFVTTHAATPQDPVIDGFVPLNLAEAFVVYADMHQPRSPNGRNDVRSDGCSSLRDEIVSLPGEATV